MQGRIAYAISKGTHKSVAVSAVAYTTYRICHKRYMEKSAIETDIVHMIHQFTTMKPRNVTLRLHAVSQHVTVLKRLPNLIFLLV